MTTATMLRRAAVAALLALPVPGPAAPAAAGTITLLGPYYAYNYRGGLFITVVCGAHASPDADQTMVECTVDGTHLEVSVYNVSAVSMPGPAATAIWFGGAQPPAEVCAYAEAQFNQPGGGPPIVESAGPVCIPIVV